MTIKKYDHGRVEARARALTRGLDFSLNEIPEDGPELRQLALAHSNLIEGRELTECDGRILVNYLRHERSGYQWNLWEIERRQGAVKWRAALELAYMWVRWGHLDAIAESYPHLAATCDYLRTTPHTPIRRPW